MEAAAAPKREYQMRVWYFGNSHEAARDDLRAALQSLQKAVTEALAEL